MAAKTAREVDLRALAEVPASECEDATRRVADRISAEFKSRGAELGASGWGQSLIGISASKPPANHDAAMRRIVGGKVVDGERDVARPE